MNLDKAMDKKIENVLKGTNFEKYVEGFHKKGYFTIDQFRQMSRQEIHQVVEKVVDEKDVYNVSEKLWSEHQSMMSKKIIIMIVALALIGVIFYFLF